MATSLLAGWLVAGGAQAQSNSPIIEITWPEAEAPRRERPLRDAAPAPQPATALEEPRVKTVVFAPPPAGQVRSKTDALTAGQLPAGRARLPADSDVEFTIRTELPGQDALFRRDSESQVFERIRLEAEARPGAQRVTFPERVPVSREPYTPRQFPQVVEQIEPSFVMHRRLYFEQKNFDRNGWELGALQPAVSSARFLYDILAMPYHAGTRPLQKWDSSAGKCLPGDTTPLLCYREEFSLTGLAAQAGAVAVGLVAFP
jgi:hypothetical protein